MAKAIIEIKKASLLPGFLIILLFSFCKTFCQPGKMDSLKKIMLLRSDSAKADILNMISKEYSQQNFDSSIWFANQALFLSQALSYKKGIAEAYRNTGRTNLFLGNRTIAKQYLDKALSFFDSLHDDKNKAGTYNNLGVLLTRSNEFAGSLTCFDSALILFRRIGDKEGEGSVLNYISINYQAQGNYQKAIDYCLQGFEIRKSINDHLGVVYSLINVGNMYLEVGQPETALKFYNESVAYAQEHNMEPLEYSLNMVGKSYLRLKQYDSAKAYLLGTTKGNKNPLGYPILLGELYSETGRLDSAIEQYQKSLAYSQQGNNTKVVAESLLGLGKVFIKKGDNELSMKYALRSYAIADSLQIKFVLANAANVLAELYETKGNYKESLHFFEIAHSILDSVTNENYQQKLAFTESKNEREQEAARIKILSAEKELQAEKIKEEQFRQKLILIVSAGALLLAFIIIRNINLKKKKIQLQKEQIDFEKGKVEKAFEELKLTQSQLIQREKMASLGELTAGIAHEIQNPLNFVNNFSEVNDELIGELVEEVDKGNTEEVKTIANDIKQNLEKINHHGKRADAIVKGMLQHSRASSGQKEPTDINALADEYLRLAYHGLRAKDKSFNAEIKTDFDSSTGRIKIVPQDIGRVLLNLYNNAFYAVNEKKQRLNGTFEPIVNVSSKKDNGKVVIKVADNGNGIPQNIVDKIFQPFFTTKPTGQGTGLGLSLAYDIIKAHGGEITVETKEGEGSEFVVELPI